MTFSGICTVSKPKSWAAAIAILEGFAHANFALALVVIPGIVHEVDAAIDGRADQSNAVSFGQPGLANMKSAHSQRRYAFTGAPQFAIRHVLARSLSHRILQQ